jgi:acetyl-CoA acetyltransferase
MPDRFEERAVITGIGSSQIGRHLNRDPLALTLEGCIAAISDAGLTPADIDGLATFPGPSATAFSLSRGLSGAGVFDVQRALRLQLEWYSSGHEVPGQLGTLFSAVMAVACGLARHVLCFRSVWESSAQGSGPRAAQVTGVSAASDTEHVRAEGGRTWSLPFGAGPVCAFAMDTARHFHDYGTTREQLAQIALTARAHASLNPDAVYRARLTLDDYLSARMISEPLCLYDCDVPVDGCLAVIVSAADAAIDCPNTPVKVEALGCASSYERSARTMWSRTSLTPPDVDVAQIYDGFSIEALEWLEGLGFCGVGESGPFVEGGKRIGLGGELPINTGGGQLSAGRVHGYVQLHEACIQLRGQGGVRQVEPRPEVAIACAGAHYFNGCILLSR